jgi:5'(3')-deoxyribonucleotidase
MQKLRIAIDIDEVLVPFMATFVKHHNQRYSSTYVVDDFYTLDWQQIWGGTREEAIAKDKIFHAEKLMRQVAPLAGAKAGLDVLREYFDLVVVTSRRDELKETTIEWLDEHFPNYFEEIAFCNHWITTGESITKSDMCSRLGAVALIDDNADYILECVEKGIFGVLFGEYAWNQIDQPLPEDAVRVLDWEEACHVVINHEF